jgi:hypothetical protein
MLQLIGDGFDRRSLHMLGVILLTYSAVGYTWRNLIDPSRGMDWLLAGIWLFMTALMVWDIRPRGDLRLFFVGLVGGGIIEAWGTQTSLWSYFTAERPPLWILPAWPAAALAVERLTRLFQRATPGLDRHAWLWWVVLLLFWLAISRFAWVSIDKWGTQVALAAIPLVGLIGARPERDLRLFLVGSALGVLLEYWGTSRYCWTYYSREIPPWEAVLSHGFASVAFGRAEQVVIWLIEKNGGERQAQMGAT